MGRMHFNHVKPSVIRAFDGVDMLFEDLVHIGARHCLRNRAVVVKRLVACR